MSSAYWKLALVGAAVGALAACGPEPKQKDPCEQLNCPAGTTCQAGACIPDDVGPGHREDAGVDAGPGDEDGGVTADAGEDAGVDEDAGVTEDAGFEFDGGLASTQISEVRAQLDDAGYTLPVEGAIVSHVIPEIGADPAGFFLQAEPNGPAIFVVADAGTVSAPPEPGDVVSLEVNAIGTQDGQRRIVGFSNYARLDTGLPVSWLSQDITAATDVVTNLDSYESELVSATGTVLNDMSFGGVGHLASDLGTEGIPSNSSFELRVPQILRDVLDLTQGCNVTVNATPMWRFKGKAQVSAWMPEDLTVNSCPAPKLLSAGATSPTSVELTFDRKISVAPKTSVQFDNGLVALSTAVAVSGNVVTVSTTPQVTAVPYTVTIDPVADVQDTLGTGVDPAANTAHFNGYAPPATIVLNEVNANMATGKDLVELKVTQGGSMKDITLEQIGTSSVVTLATLPDVIVTAGDLIVVHFSVTSGTETTAKDQIPQATQADYYDGAWDVQGASSGMSATADRVLRVSQPDGTVTDEVPFVTQTATPSTQFLDELTAMTGAGTWTPACVSSPCDANDAKTLGVDWNGLQNTAASSVYRTNLAVTRSKADWVKANTGTGLTASFGAANP